MTPTLWPRDLGRRRVSTPLAVMRKQARQLAKLSEGWLNAEVRTTDSGSNAPLQHSFVVTAPYLGEIEFQLFSVRHSLMIYPITISTNQYFPSSGYECFDEDEFLDSLRDILTAEATCRIITSLISQSEDSQQTDEDLDSELETEPSVVDHPADDYSTEESPPEEETSELGAEELNTDVGDSEPVEELA